MSNNGPKLANTQTDHVNQGTVHIYRQFQPVLFICFTIFDVEKWPKTVEKRNKWPELVNMHTDLSNMGLTHIYQRILIGQTP